MISKQVRKNIRSVSIWIKVFVLTVFTVAPLVTGNTHVGAAQLTSRKVTISTSKAGATASQAFVFTLGTTGNIGSVEFLFCTTPLGTCVAPTGMNAAGATLSLDEINNTDMAFTLGTAGDAPTANRIRIQRTVASASAGQVAEFTFSGIVNPTTVNTTFYPRISTFSGTYTGVVDTGVVAASTAQQLTVSARVQERLDFCVGTTAVNNSTTTPGATCAAISGNSVDLGIVDSSTTCISGPSNPCEDDTGVNGVAMVRTNAFEGVVIDYFAEQNSGYGGLKVPGATCAVNTTMGSGATTDQCFNSAGTTQAAFANGTEGFGMTVSHVNNANVSAYTGTNLVRDVQYDGDASIGQGFAWDASGTVDRIASSAGSSIKVVENEALILRFAAASSIVTPTGQYSVVSTYIATPTF